MATKYNLLDTSELNKDFSLYRQGRTDYLLTRELPVILEKHDRSKRILDYGCGAGLSTRFLKSLGLNVVGVDISKAVLDLARKNDLNGHYLQINEQNDLPFNKSEFKIVVSTFVLFAIPTLNEIIAVFKRINRVLDKDGVFIAVTGSTEMYKRDWLSLEVKQFPQNNNPKSGDACKIKLTEVDLVLEDYFWTDEDYEQVAKQSNFVIANKTYPLGKDEDGIAWKDEKKFPPYVFYEFKKTGV